MQHSNIYKSYFNIFEVFIFNRKTLESGDDIFNFLLLNLLHTFTLTVLFLGRLCMQMHNSVSSWLYFKTKQNTKKKFSSTQKIHVTSHLFTKLLCKIETIWHILGMKRYTLKNASSFKGVVQWSQCAITCNWMNISRRNLHKMIPCTHLTDGWYRVYQNSIFF